MNKFSSALGTAACFGLCKGKDRQTIRWSVWTTENWPRFEFDNNKDGPRVKG